MSPVPGTKNQTGGVQAHRDFVELEAKKLFLEWYFSIYQAYKVAVKLYRLGKLDVKFPAGTYRPPVFSAG